MLNALKSTQPSYNMHGVTANAEVQVRYVPIMRDNAALSNFNNKAFANDKIMNFSGKSFILKVLPSTYNHHTNNTVFIREMSFFLRYMRKLQKRLYSTDCFGTWLIIPPV